MPNIKLSPALQQKVAEAAESRKSQEALTRAESYLREAARAINEFAQHHLQYVRDQHGVDLKVQPVLVMFKRPREYYEAWFEAALLIGRDTYLLDRQVQETVAEVFPEACRRAQYSDRLPDSLWYKPFGETLQKRINGRFQYYGITDDCNSLAKLRDLIKSGMTGNKSPEAETGQDFPQGRFYFNGDGTVYWFGSELTIQRKGNGGTQYVKFNGKSLNLIKELVGMGVSRPNIERWVKNAEMAYRRRMEAEATHQQNMAEFGSKYD